MFEEDEDLKAVLQRGSNQKSILTGYFKKNQIDTNARKMKYAEFQRYYVWNARNKKWTPCQRHCSIGRIY